MGFLPIQVQPDQEGLTANMEEQAEDRESNKSDVKLGRLQFRIDYDFNQSNVRLLLITPLSLSLFSLSLFLYLFLLCLLSHFFRRIDFSFSSSFVLPSNHESRWRKRERE